MGSVRMKSPPNRRPMAFVDLGIQNAEQFWLEVVEPDYHDFMEHPTVRRSRAVAASLVDFMEWRFHEIDPSTGLRWQTYKTDLIQQCASLGMLLDIYETFKHRGLIRSKTTIAVNSLPIRSGRSGAGGYGVPTGGYGTGSIAQGSGRFEPMIYCNNGTQRWLREAVEDVRAFWIERRNLRG